LNLRTFIALNWNTFWQYSRTWRAFNDCVALFSCSVSMQALGSEGLSPVQIKAITTLLTIYFYLDGLGSLACAHSGLINAEIVILQTVGRTHCMGNQPIARLLSTQDNTNTE
jgi:hypothetical protein